ncbi:ATP-binding protein, partial [candidate division KSB1 bacterium]|nr:ATP-binding protein [candidate division KSB1 bacterium]
AKYTKQELNGQISEYLEGGVLQESHSEDNSSFNVVLIDLENRLQKIHQYIWDENFYNCSQESDQWEDFQRSKFLLKQEFGIDNKFQQYLCDAGANFTHPRKDPLLLSDIYVYPNFRDLEIDSNADTLSFTMIEGKNLVSYALAANHLVIAGPEQSGKTALAKTLFLEFHQKGFIPVLLTGDSLTKFKEEKILKEIYDKFIKQYSSDLLEKYKQLEKEKRVLLIDDFHHIKANKKGKNRILDVLIKRFGKVIILGNDLFRLEEFIYQKEEENLQLNFKHLELKEFGYLLREKIIEKWYLMGQEYSIDEGEITHKILQAHNMVDTILGNNLLPSFPIFILIILQQIEANTPLNTTTGSFGYFYEVLITKALASTSREIDLDTKYNYLSELAYKMLTSKTRKMTESEMRNFHDYYCLEYIEIPYAKLIDDLVEASIFDFLDNYYRFKYKFIYYYFVARYLRDNITEKEIKKIIVSISKKIYNEEFANILIFLCYLSKDPFIINEILKNAKEVYKEESPCDLEKNIMFLNKMYKKLPQVILLATDPKRNREALLKERDEIEENQEKTQADKDEVEDYDLKDRLLQNRGREALD